MSNKIQIAKKEIKKIILENIEAFKNKELEKHIGEPSDRKIEYSPMPGIENPSDSMDKPSEFTGGETGTLSGEDLTTKMKSSPSQLLGFLDKLEEAKSILSKVAAKETDQEVKAKIYSYYDKTQKVAFEMIKEFGVVH